MTLLTTVNSAELRDSSATTKHLQPLGKRSASVGPSLLAKQSVRGPALREA